MSLVINSNEWWWAFRISNDWNYPDFSQILIIPNDTIWTWTIDNQWSVYTVNWTPVNEESNEIIAPACFSSATDIGVCRMSAWSDWWSESSSFTRTYRLWLNKPLSAWLTIWKNIIFWIWGTEWWWSVSNTTYSCSIRLTLVFRLLHTDWTLTDIWTRTHTFSYNVYWWTNRMYAPWQFWISTNWVVSQEWDIVVVDATVYAFWWNRNFRRWWIVFWYTLGNWPSTAKWIQISVE